MDTMKRPVHPGEVIKADVLDEAGISVSEAAESLGVSRVALSRVLNGRAAVSASLAVRLEEAGAGTARLWLGMQAAYDLAAERRRDHGDIRPLVVLGHEVGDTRGRLLT